MTNEASTSSAPPTADLGQLSLAGTASTPAPVEDGYAGGLPDFSDDEQPTASSSTPKPRKMTTGGRKLISKLKGRAPPPGGAKPKPAPSKVKDKAKMETIQTAGVAGEDDDEEGGTLEMNEEMLAMVMAQLQQQGANAELTKEKVQAMVQGKSSTSAGKQLAKDME